MKKPIFARIQTMNRLWGEPAISRHMSICGRAKQKITQMSRLYLILFIMMFAVVPTDATAAAAGHVKSGRDKVCMFRVTLRDKQGTPFGIHEADRFLSGKAVERRRRQHVETDSTDLPVSPVYVRKVAETGVEVVSKSKWNNTLLVRTRRQQQIKAVEALACVKTVRKVWTAPDTVARPTRRQRFHDEFRMWDDVPPSHYGVAHAQIEMLGGTELHKRGFKGKGMTIAVLDGGFMNADMIPCMKKIDVAGWADFVVPQSKSVFNEIEHGTKVLSVMGVNEPESFVGTAPEATYWLLRCEDGRTESLAEEDYWAAAVEFADSVGVDVVSSSLGYHAFDNKADDYRYSQLDGQTSMISHTASMLADKGIILVNSAGNDGMGAWKKINVPADADNILTVGAVTPQKQNAAFSAVGPTADGRVKPDVMAMGSPTAVITGRGTIIKDIGTSFSAPLVSGLVACLWQALPSKTAKEIMTLVRNSGDNAATPDNIYGYGVPDFKDAYDKGRSKSEKQKP